MSGQYCSENLHMLLVHRRLLYGQSNAVIEDVMIGVIKTLLLYGHVTL